MGTVLGVVVLPLLALLLFAVGIGLLVASPDAFGAVAFVLFTGVAILPGLAAVTMLRGWFAIEVDSSALSLVGLFGKGRLRLAWDELDGVGLVRWRGARFLSVRPLRAWTSMPRRGVMRWDPARRLLLISGLERWSRTSDELLRSVRENAGSKWRDPLHDPIDD